MFASASRSLLGFAFMDSREPPNRAGGGGSILEAVRPRRDHRSQSGEAWLRRRCRAVVAIGLPVWMSARDGIGRAAEM